MLNQFSRTELIFGREAMERLAKSRVAVFGIGGVGGYAVEALARSGVGTLDLIDDDRICLTNLNRQVLATRGTVGQYKVDAARERIHAVCPETAVNVFRCFYLPETAGQFDFSKYDYVIDAIDTVSGKLQIIRQAQALDVPVISCMMDPAESSGYFRISLMLLRISGAECCKIRLTTLAGISSTISTVSSRYSSSSTSRSSVLEKPRIKSSCASESSSTNTSAASSLGSSRNTGGMYNGDHARKDSLVQYGFRLPCAYDNRPLKFEEFEQRVNQAIYVSATPGDYERERAGQVVEQVIRPTGLLDPRVEVRPVEGQIDDLISEINGRAAKSERVLVTTLTKKMAEDLTDYFKNAGVRVRYMHSDVETIERMEIIRDLRLGEFDVLVGINLLREGLDLPEVSLVAVLDADKEGFLRSETSLIQTIGRAARNSEGMTAREKADVLCSYVDEHVRYDDTFRYYGGYDAAVTGTAVCEGYTAFYNCLCNLAGVPMTAVTDSHSLDHAWSRIQQDGVYYNVDATYCDQDDEWGRGYMHDRYFWVTDDAIRASDLESGPARVSDTAGVPYAFVG